MNKPLKKDYNSEVLYNLDLASYYIKKSQKYNKITLIFLTIALILLIINFLITIFN